VKVEIELFTHIKSKELKFQELRVLFNQKYLNFSVKDLSLIHGKPLKIQRDLYLDETKIDHNEEILILNQVIASLSDTPINI
jgi:hypothetical protein